jgi:hypothetical protein
MKSANTSAYNAILRHWKVYKRKVRKADRDMVASGGQRKWNQAFQRRRQVWSTLERNVRKELRWDTPVERTPDGLVVNNCMFFPN